MLKRDGFVVVRSDMHFVATVAEGSGQTVPQNHMVFGDQHRAVLESAFAGVLN